MKQAFAVLDIETKESFFSVGAYDPSKLTVSVVGLYTSADDQFQCFLETELAKLWPLLEQADMVVGFNLFGFDYPVLQKYYSGQLSKLSTLDILAEFKRDHSFRIKLDSLAQATLGVGKSGDGLKAIELWEKGNIEELKSYCLDDVRLTRDIYVQGRDTGVLYYPDREGKKVSWMVDWNKSKDSSHNLTLPF